MKVIIVGGVAGGASAAARLRRLDEQAEIVLLERGPYISFANCGLPYYISGEIRDRAQLSVQTPESFAARFAVDVRILSEAVDVDRNSKTVTIVDHATGRRYQERYDKLLLSPGAEPVRPPLPGVDNARIFTLRTIPDAVAIRTFLETQHPTQALIVGAGYIGMEMAEALHTAGLHVTVVEMLPHAIGPLDYDMACQVHQYAREKGVQLKLNCGVASFEEKAAPYLHISQTAAYCPAIWCFCPPAYARIPPWRKRQGWRPTKKAPSLSMTSCAPARRISTPWATPSPSAMPSQTCPAMCRRSEEHTS